MLSLRVTNPYTVSSFTRTSIRAHLQQSGTTHSLSCLSSSPARQPVAVQLQQPTSTQQSLQPSRTMALFGSCSRCNCYQTPPSHVHRA